MLIRLVSISWALVFEIVGWVRRIPEGARRARALSRGVPMSTYRLGAAGLLAMATIGQTDRLASDSGGKQSTATPRPVVEAASHSADRVKNYSWLSRAERAAYMPLVDRIPLPAGFERASVEAGSFADWLRHLPARPANAEVRDHRDKVLMKADDPQLAAVVALQPRMPRLLGACNIVIRLRAEHAWATKRFEGLGFHFTSGHFFSWGSWAAGVRPKVQGRSVEFREGVVSADSSRESFCSYLETLFEYTSSSSLLDDTRAADDRAIGAGDVFLRTGKKSRVLLVLDAATNEVGAVRVLLGEGGAIPQTFHVLRDERGSAWFEVVQDEPLALGEESGEIGIEQLRHWR